MCLWNFKADFLCIKGMCVYSRKSRMYTQVKQARCIDHNNTQNPVKVSLQMIFIFSGCCSSVHVLFGGHSEYIGFVFVPQMQS